MEPNLISFDRAIAEHMSQQDALDLAAWHEQAGKKSSEAHSQKRHALTMKHFDNLAVKIRRYWEMV